MNIPENSAVLSSWKDIAKYLGKGVRTVQRWERHLGLPVRRPIGASQKSAVVLYRGDVDAWLATRFSARALQKNEVRADQMSSSARTNLTEGIRTARELRTANHALTEQISACIRQLAERCDQLTSQTLHVPYQAADLGRPGELAMLQTAELLPAPLPAPLALDRLPTERIA
jgi:hypothetical protein